MPSSSSSICSTPRQVHLQRDVHVHMSCADVRALLEDPSKFQKVDQLLGVARAQGLIIRRAAMAKFADTILMREAARELMAEHNYREFRRKMMTHAPATEALIVPLPPAGVGVLHMNMRVSHACASFTSCMCTSHDFVIVVSACPQA